MIKAIIFDMFETLVSLHNNPPYFAKQISADAGIAEADFRVYWDSSDDARSIGEMTLEELLEKILRANDRYSDELLQNIARKRVMSRAVAFQNIRGDIIPMLAALKDMGMLIGLISNCFSEEVGAIRESALFPYFDAVCLSYEEGVLKPDIEIYRRCAQKLGVAPGECLYVGDGGSRELEAARDIGMTPLRAAWYQDDARGADFVRLGTPMDIILYI